jgi:hypothetical protein
VVGVCIADRILEIEGQPCIVGGKSGTRSAVEPLNEVLGGARPFVGAADFGDDNLLLANGVNARPPAALAASQRSYTRVRHHFWPDIDCI